VEGDQLKVRVWADGASEPGVWNMEATDSSLTSGVLQVNAWSQIATVYNWYIDDLTLTDISGGSSLISSTFDTGFSGGVQLQSILWQGSETHAADIVRFQIASSDCPGGHSNPPTCSVGGWGVPSTGDGAYIGSDGSNTKYYNPGDPNTVYAIPANHHNSKRYVRYLVDLAAGAGGPGPTINDIIVNWTP